ncbi:WXG100 family type VII secretion target [Nocardia sp. CS682]|uniref:WXG100 family type VII secretion target n=1 Tax=Nocardia sp. CS682 TaxID=1047172 RepID=UPI001074D2F3|nr:WXG100 family type VII secretion target [Nocardia sp. CS682]QBS42970.1 WXG100 family type VII secretion target [Nocardia sp. CS682]
MSLTSLGGSDKAVGVEAGGIDSVVSDLETAINNLRTSVKEIDQAAQDVLKGWKGDASSKFVQVAQDWHDEAEDLNKRFDLFTQAVNEGKSKLQAMDQA